MNTTWLQFRSRISLSALLLLALLLLLGACQAGGESAEAPQDEPIAGDPLPGDAETAPTDPIGVTTAFYTWYLDYTQPAEGRNPLVNGAYRDSEYLSTGWVKHVDELLAQMREEYGGAGYDPFLMAQDLPRDFTVETWEVAENDACVVVHQQFGESIHDLTVDLTREAGAWKIDRIRAGSPLTPDGVARLFLEGYVAQVRSAMEGSGVEPLSNATYRESDYLTAGFVEEVDATIAGFDKGGYDPFLLAQDVPHAFNFRQPRIDGDSASVEVGRYFVGQTELSTIVVELIRSDGRWLIDGIGPTEEAQSTHGMSPAEVVEAFYLGWRQQVRAAMADDGPSPLGSGAYRENPYLTPAFAEKVDAIVAGFDRGGYDPFLCAQDVPEEIALDGTIYTTSGARVAAHSSFANHAFVVALHEVADDTWQIDDVVCPGTPASNAEIFYTWYLAYTRDCCVFGAPITGEMRNPLVDGAYRDAPYVDPGFIAALDAELEEMKAAGGYSHDPVLEAQAFPPDFTVESTETEGVVLVDMAFANEHRLHVDMTLIDGQWMVSDVNRLESPPPPLASEVDTSDWSVVVDEAYGFTFKIPAGWVAQPQNLEGPGMPDDWPVVSQYLVMPEALAEEMAARTGPPDPSAPPLIAPFVVSFLQGDEAAFDRAYPVVAMVDLIAINERGIEVQRQEGEYALPRYVLRDGDRWIIVEDVVNEFPGREVQAAEVFGVLDGILATLAFSD